MALQIIDHGSSMYAKMVYLRDEVLRKPLGLKLTQDELNEEVSNTLIVAHENEQLLGCCMLVPVDGAIVRLRQMAVTHRLQGKGIGQALLQFSETIARDNGYKKLTMNARDTAVHFYEKFGYLKLGDPFWELSIKHYKMEKKL